MSSQAVRADQPGLTVRVVERLVELWESPHLDRFSTQWERELMRLVGGAAEVRSDPVVRSIVRLGQLVGGPPTIRLPGADTGLDAQYGALALGAAFCGAAPTAIDEVLGRNSRVAVAAAALSLGATRHTHAESVLRAFGLGCEIATRLAHALGPGHVARGWDSTGTCGVVGAAVAGGLLADLDAMRLTMAVAVASSSTLGQLEAAGSMVERLHAGKAAANGVLAVLLAECGFTGSDAAFEAPRGLLRVLSDDVHEEALLEDLGSTWRFLAGLKADQSADRIERTGPSALERVLCSLVDGEERT